MNPAETATLREDIRDISNPAMTMSSTSNPCLTTRRLSGRPKLSPRPPGARSSPAPVTWQQRRWTTGTADVRHSAPSDRLSIRRLTYPSRRALGGLTHKPDLDDTGSEVHEGVLREEAQVGKTSARPKRRGLNILFLLGIQRRIAGPILLSKIGRSPVRCSWACRRRCFSPKSSGGNITRLSVHARGAGSRC
jgi:hypothetical protein